MYVTREVRRKLRVLAAERSLSVSELMRQSVQKYFDSEGVDISLSEGLDTWGRKREEDKSDDAK